MTEIFGDYYDDTLDLLDDGVCSVFVPLREGLYRAMFAPANWKVRERMLDDPNGFAITAARKTREFAIKQGYEVED